MSVTKRRRKFSREFKIDGVRLAEEKGIVSAAKDLEVHQNVLRKWVKEFESDPEHAFPGNGCAKVEQPEIEVLRREIAKLRSERDMLKKAAAFFAKEAAMA